MKQVVILEKKAKETKMELKKKTLAVTRARQGRDQAQKELCNERLRFQELMNQKDIEISQLMSQIDELKRREADFKKI